MKHRLQAAALALAMVGALSGCAALQDTLGGLLGPEPTPTPTAAPTATPAPTAAPTPTPEPAANPLTGELGDYAGKRPVAVSLRTETGAWPLWGTASADVLIEGVTEGRTAGLTALYANVDGISKVGPVAPGRDLFLQFALPLNAVPVHIDKNIYASNLLNALSYQDVDGYHIGTAAFAFDEGRAQSGYREENCWYATADLVRAGLENYGVSTDGETIRLFDFGEAPAPEAQNGTDLFLTFAEGDTEELIYDASTGLYLKNNADGSPMMDADSGAQAAFTNVFVLYASSGVKDDRVTRDYDLAGGTGLYLTKGGWQQITWEKGDATAPLKLKNAAGESLTVNTGKSFIGVYGGYYGQAIELYGADGTAQTLPDAPALMDSGVPGDIVATAETAYREQQEAIAASEAALQPTAEPEAAAGDADGEAGAADSAATQGAEDAAAGEAPASSDSAAG